MRLQKSCVKFCATPHHLGGASYSQSGELVFNKFRLGADWFERGVNEEVVRLLIHEFAQKAVGVKPAGWMPPKAEIQPYGQIVDYVHE